ncbi:MAG: hypothetical protein EOO87_01655 [Pedobacter sp.]|nr:MAG: hypothetical protein EOO87_01655 [Pedobacter sp.]
MSFFDCLYLLENADFSIVEIKINDLPAQASASEKFHWLKIDKSSLQISPLTFSSMDSHGEIEERYFDNGFLKFDSKTGTFIEKYNSAQHQLISKNDKILPEELIQQIEVYLN